MKGIIAYGFSSVPACRMGAFRVVVAISTICSYLPYVHGQLLEFGANAYHYPPEVDWLPIIPKAAIVSLVVVSHLASWLLLFGFCSRLSACFLAVSGFYILLVDPYHYYHNSHFHLTLLALLACGGGMSLARLMRDDAVTARDEAWPEWLLRWQICIVYFYAGVDKMFSERWGLEGQILVEMQYANHGPLMAFLVQINQQIVTTYPGLFSVATILIELLLAIGIAIPALWRYSLVMNVGFGLWVEFLVKPGVFGWDLAAVSLLLLPAADRAYLVNYHPANRMSLWIEALIVRLDWHRRLVWSSDDSRGAAGKRPWLSVSHPGGDRSHNLIALANLIMLMPGPLLIVLMALRFCPWKLFGIITPEHLVFPLILGIGVVWLSGRWPALCRTLKNGK